MKRFPAAAHALVFGALLAASCGGTQISGDAADDSREDEAPDVAGDDLPPAGPITFVLWNDSSDIVYLDWSFGGPNTITGERTSGGAWEELNFWTPDCMAACEDYDPGEWCCVGCMPPPRVKELHPGDGLQFEWDGAGVYTVDDAYCEECSCSRSQGAGAMGYKAIACVYHDIHCTAICNPDENGEYDLAGVSGDPSCFETLFDIPYAGDEVVVIIE